jgi:hypothetical protein
MEIDKILEDIIVYKRDSIKVLEDLRSRMDPINRYSQPAETPSFNYSNDMMPAPLHISNLNISPDTKPSETEGPKSPSGKSGIFGSRRLSILRSRSKERKPEYKPEEYSGQDNEWGSSPTAEFPFPNTHVSPLVQSQYVEPSFQADHLAVPAPYFSNDKDTSDDGYSDKILVSEQPNTSTSPTSQSPGPISLPSPLPDRTSILSTSTEGTGRFPNNRFSHSSSMIDRMSTVSSRASTQSRPLSILGSTPHSPISPAATHARPVACPTGFCKGAWSARTEPKKGLTLSTVPVGIYGRKHIWQCKHCSFTGDTPGGKAFDPRVLVDEATGIQYRWMFTAKSHAKTKGEASSFGCVFCADSGVGTAVYGQMSTLLAHISTAHKRITPEMAKTVKCTLGKGDTGDDWDIWLPFGVHGI